MASGTLRRVASRTVRARLDEPSARGLRLLVQSGLNESEAVRLALSEARERRQRRSLLAAEAAALAADPNDRAEMAAVRRDMDAVSAGFCAESFKAAPGCTRPAS